MHTSFIKCTSIPSHYYFFISLSHTTTFFYISPQNSFELSPMSCIIVACSCNESPCIIVMMMIVMMVVVMMMIILILIVMMLTMLIMIWAHPCIHYPTNYSPQQPLPVMIASVYHPILCTLLLQPHHQPYSTTFLHKVTDVARRPPAHTTCLTCHPFAQKRSHHPPTPLRRCSKQIHPDPAASPTTICALIRGMVVLCFSA